MTTSYLAQNRDTLTRFVRAYVAGAYLALADAAKAKQLIAQKYKTSDPKVIDATYADFQRLMPRDAAPSIDGAQNVLDQLVNRNLLQHHRRQGNRLRGFGAQLHADSFGKRHLLISR